MFPKYYKSLGLILLMVFIILSSASISEGASKKGKNQVTLKWAMEAKLASQDAYKDLMKLVEKRTGIKIEPILLPGDAIESNKKLVVSLMSGDEIDIVYTNTPNGQKLAKAQLIKPLDDIIAQTKYPAEKIFGTTLKRHYGKIQFLPSQRDVHITIYNKKIFDDAKVPYPDNATWTWDKYLETAKKLTDKNKGIYGSYMLDWDPYFTFSAKQKKVPAYKPDGTSNFDHPAWAESMKFFADRGNVYQVQPDFLTFKSKKMPYDAFASGKYGMWVVGNWALCIPADQKNYPRDWKIGVAIMPQVQAGQKTTLGVVGGYAVCSTTKHFNEAFKAIQCMAEYEWTLPYGRVPSRVDLSTKQANEVAKMLIKNLEDDGITEKDMKACILDSKLDIVDEKIVGPGMTLIDYTLIPQIGELYATGQRTLEQAMKELKEKSDRAIEEDK